MSDGSILDQVKAASRAAMKARDKDRLATLRLIQAEFKRIEVDERVTVDDARALSILDKMVKQRRDSQAQYEEAGRAELAAQEAAEIDVIADFLPTPLTDAELEALVDAAIAASGAGGMQAMGAVMGELKPKLAGRADMGAVSQLVKARLSG